MKIETIREMTPAELSSELLKLKNELFNLRFQHVTGQLENPVKMREVKKDIARVKTVIKEKSLRLRHSRKEDTACQKETAERQKLALLSATRWIRPSLYQ